MAGGGTSCMSYLMTGSSYVYDGSSGKQPSKADYIYFKAVSHKRLKGELKIVFILSMLLSQFVLSLSSMYFQQIWCNCPQEPYGYTVT